MSDDKKGLLSRLFPRLQGKALTESLQSTVNELGIAFQLPADSSLEQAGLSRVKLQLALLEQFEEQSRAVLVNGQYLVQNSAVQALDEEERVLLGLPEFFKGQVKLATNGRTSNPDFEVKLNYQDANGEFLPRPRRVGATITFGEAERYLVTEAHSKLLDAIDKHESLAASARNESANILLVSAAKLAQANGLNIDCSHFNNLKVSAPEKVGVAVTREEDGSLTLLPTFGQNESLEATERRLGQFEQADSDSSVFRSEDNILLLQDKAKQGVDEVMTHRSISAECADDFLKQPSSYLDAEVVDLDFGFSTRVRGLTEYRFVPNRDMASSGIQWFDDLGQPAPTEALIEEVQTKEDLAELEALVQAAAQNGADSLRFGDVDVDVSDKERLRRVLEDVRSKVAQVAEPEPSAPEEPSEDEEEDESSNVSAVTFDIDETDLSSRFRPEAKLVRELSFGDLKKKPYPHQLEGINWLLDMADQYVANAPGAIMADDMGLGKTFMACVGMQKWLQLQSEKGDAELPMLVVAPLSLLENWEEEVKSTFTDFPFDEIVVLQGGRHLPMFKLPGRGRETRQELDSSGGVDLSRVQFSLKVGEEYGRRRLDLPRTLVLCSYDTLRSYQLSLAKVKWGWVVFDEAQNLKNPDSQQSIAGNALNAEFKLLATGTPVENRLMDFWCLMNIACPGYLGSQHDFRDLYVKPAEENAVVAGRALREKVGRLMLRRTKEDVLTDLTRKFVLSGAVTEGRAGIKFCPDLRLEMKGEQLVAYDRALKDYQGERETGGGHALAALQQMKLASLHADLLEKENESETLLGAGWFERGAKLEALKRYIAEIAKRDEKAIIFAITKRFQRMLKVWLESEFNVPVKVINGETKAVGDGDTRKNIIADFQQADGFGLIIMSPVAAGVGLTITAANHVLHVERHWNPAKEAQATDRAYRIGQKKDVFVYFPVSAHPTLTSFDDHLDKLLTQKIDLKDAVVVPTDINNEQMYSAMDA